ncbi:MAG TPA: beta-ketoacyl-ACP synthase III [Gemmatimonadota bacterium]|nr:beta-ketoacyl-ACP synthase III [Gemmatimonadota bacterium]
MRAQAERLPLLKPHGRGFVRSTGMAVPERVVTNDDLARIVDTSDEWIRTRSGIRERRMCAEGQNTADLAAEAGLKALEEAGVDPLEVEVIILSTATPDHLLPATACETQARMGADRAAGFDISAACAGWIYGLTIADGLLTTGVYQNVLVIGAEKMSAILDYTDRTTCVLFGDGAGAALLGPGDDPADGGSGLLATHMQTDGRQAEILWRPAGGAAMPSTLETQAERLEYVKQEGREVFKSAVLAMEESSRIVLHRAGLTIDEVDWVIPHQANIRIIDAVAKRLNVPMSRVFVNIDRYGNTSSASIPIALDEARKQGRTGVGDTILMTAFGGGLAWGAALLRL